MEERKITTVVRINGADYTIVSSADEEYVRHVAFYVDKKMQELARRDKRLSTALTAVLTSVNIADEYFQSQSDNERLRAQILEYAKEAVDNKATSDQLRAEVERLTAENQAMQLEKVKLETELAHNKGNQNKPYNNNNRQNGR